MSRATDPSLVGVWVGPGELGNNPITIARGTDSDYDVSMDPAEEGLSTKFMLFRAGSEFIIAGEARLEAVPMVTGDDGQNVLRLAAPLGGVPLRMPGSTLVIGDRTLLGLRVDRERWKAHAREFGIGDATIRIWLSIEQQGDRIAARPLRREWIEGRAGLTSLKQALAMVVVDDAAWGPETVFVRRENGRGGQPN
ncbi:MAG: hypothetical protein RBS39_01060 [Phycisphaerales bacterium]|nr:hypothetical protein [Phycisphaerales bacterium]